MWLVLGQVQIVHRQRDLSRHRRKDTTSTRTMTRRLGGLLELWLELSVDRVPGYLDDHATARVDVGLGALLSAHLKRDSVPGLQDARWPCIV